MSTLSLHEILVYIDQHIYEKITLTDLSSLAGYSPFYFSKLFSESMGMSVTRYVRIRKLQHSLCSLLEGKTILDVSLMYGFESHEGFTRSFSKLFGSTPSTAKKYLKDYHIPPLTIPDIYKKGELMKPQPESLTDTMHQLVFEILKNSLEEAQLDYCTEIVITFLSNNTLSIADNGRGILLSQDKSQNTHMLNQLFAGHPISLFEYFQTEDFPLSNLQAVNSLCENLCVHVYRNGTHYCQDYIRGIAQHDIICEETGHASGTEIILKPDASIFEDMTFSVNMIQNWIAAHHFKHCRPQITICEKS